ncbi:MAG: tyrosine-type recombinase/integrase [Candidatus Hydrothermarchaeaceae archaeon]
MLAGSTLWVELFPMTKTNPTNNESRYEGYKSFPEAEEGLKSYPEVQTWLKTVSEISRRQYLRVLTKFCEFCGKTPDQLILERDKELRNLDPNSRTGIRDLILDFRSYLEKEEYAPKTINSWDGTVRGFFTAVIGKEGMINVKNYRDGHVSKKKDLVPTLEEVKKMLDAVNLEEKFRILFIAQTGMRVSDALALKIGDVQRELELERVPLAITYLPKKDRESIGERITFLASDGVELLKQCLKWREKRGENITPESPLFSSRTRRGIKPLTQQKFNKTVKRAAGRAGLDGNGRYGIIRTHSLRKFFITQLTNHGVEDKIINFFVCHKISDVDRVYWFRRVEELRKIYAERQRYLNPINNVKKYDLSKIKDIKAKIKELEKRVKELEESKSDADRHHAKIVTSEEEIIKFAELGYDCQSIGADKWLMKKSIFAL